MLGSDCYGTIKGVTSILKEKGVVTGRKAERRREGPIMSWVVASFLFNPESATHLFMTEKQVNLTARLKRLGFTKGNQMRLYGEVFELVSEPILIADDVVLMDATDKKSGLSRRVRIPLPIVKMASAA
jgi:hypothetical protein